MDVSPDVSHRTAHHSLGGRCTFGRRKIWALEVALALKGSACGWIEVARSTDQVGYHLGQRDDGFLSGIARRHLAVRGREPGKGRVPSLGQFTGERLPKLVSQIRIGSAQTVQASIPLRLEVAALVHRLAKLG